MKATVVKEKKALEWMPLTLLPANCLFTSKERLSSRWLKMDRLMFFIHDDGRMVYVTTIADGEFAVVQDEKVVLEF